MARILAFVPTLLLAALPVWSQAPTAAPRAALFEELRVITTAADGVEDVAVADIDGDGDLDVIADASPDGRVAWYPNNGGTFGAARNISGSGGPAQIVEPADMNGDGDLDVLVVQGSSLGWYENTDGTGVFSGPETVTSGANGAEDVKAADLDGDGDLDVLMARGSTISWFRNLDGNGSFGPPIVVTNGADGVEEVNVADIDGDGDLDLLAAARLDNTIAWYENTNGQGAFGGAQPLTADAEGAESVVGADIDGDGDTDVLAASHMDSTVAWFENMNGTGAFSPPIVITNMFFGAEVVAAVDLDADGDLDALSSSARSSGIEWYENTNGQGAFGPPQVLSADLESVQDVLAADLDGDGDNDVLTAWSGRIAWFVNESINAAPFGLTSSTPARNALDVTPAVTIALTFDTAIDGATVSRETIRVDGAQSGPVAGSFGGAGTPTITFDPTSDLTPGDLVTVRISPGLRGAGGEVLTEAETFSFTVAAGSGGTFVSIETTIATGPPGIEEVVAADLDGDGDLDLVSVWAERIVWYRNTNGQGSFEQAQVVVSDATLIQAVSVADLDGDGDPDLLADSSPSGRLAWYENTNGQGAFGPPRIVASGIPGVQAALAADLDGDGDFDALAARSSAIVWFPNEGPGSFDEAETVADAGAGVEDVAVGDLDDDGDLDVVSGQGDTVLWYANTGNGSFPSTSAITSSAAGVEDVAVADLDGDGRLDVLSASRQDDRIAWYRNTGGAFGPAQNITTSADGAEFVVAADLDGDGDLDVLTASNNDDTIAWYENMGGGVFAAAQPLTTSADGVENVAAADLDGDGDLDVVGGWRTSGSSNTIAWFENGAANSRPTVNNPIANQTLTIGTPFGIDLNTVFSDPDGDALSFSASSNNTSVATTAVSGAMLTVNPLAVGGARITVTADDGRGGTFSTTFDVTVSSDNAPPTVDNPLADRTLSVGTPLRVDLTGVFSDPDGDALSFSASSNNTSVAMVSVSASTLTVDPLTVGGARITVTASDGRGGSAQDQFDVTVSENPPPRVTHTPPDAPVAAGEPLTVSAEVVDEAGLREVTLLVQRGGEAGFSELAMSASGDTYTATVSASSVTSRGLRYFIRAENQLSLRTESPTYPVQVRVEGEGLVRSITTFGSAATAYRLVSVPLDLDDASPRGVLEDDLGTYDDEVWRFFGLNAAQNYVEFPNAGAMAPGRGFWLIVRDAGQQFDTGPGVSTALDADFTVNLNAGWTFVGTPFDFPIPLTQVAMNSGQALDIRTYTGSWTNLSGPMQPFVGYAVFANAADQLEIDPIASATASAEAAPKREAVAEAASAPWSIRIRAQAGQARDEDNVVAVSPDASAGWDALDRPEPPVIGDYVSVAFPHPEWNAPVDRFSADVRPEPAESDVWRFDVMSNIRATATLAFDGLESVPPEYAVWLIDEALGVRQDLRETPRYTYVSAGSGPAKRFGLVVGRAEAVRDRLDGSGEVPERLTLANFPNPFNPTTTIHYGLPEDGRVTLAVYTLLGERVAVLEAEAWKAAGRHTAVWNGRDDGGRAAASGVYLYMLEAGDVRMTRKMVLMK